MELKLVIGPNPVLEQVAAPVTEVTDETREIAKQMLLIMRHGNGVGLAANQVGLLQRIIVIDSIMTKYDRRICINPEVLERSEETAWDIEGCLSWPNHQARIERPTRIRVRYLNRDGTEVCEFLHNLAARVFLHELDHLDGINITNQPAYRAPRTNPALMAAMAISLAGAQTKRDAL